MSNGLDRESSFSLPQLEDDFYLSPERERQYAELAESLRALDLLLDAGAETKIYSMAMLVEGHADHSGRSGAVPFVRLADSTNTFDRDEAESISDFNYSDVEIDV